MKEERMKILEMLQEGKISAEDAVKLLEALGDTPEENQEEEPSSESHERQRRSRRRQRRRRGPRHIHVELGDDFDHLQDEIQERIQEARETLRASMPRIKRTVREAMPEINRIVNESMPDVGKIIRDAMQTASEAFSCHCEEEDSHEERVTRQITRTTEIKPGSRLAFRSRRGHMTT